MNNSVVIVKNKAEIQSGYDRQSWAEGLIQQLPPTHDGRNSWLLNYGRSAEAQKLRLEHPQKPAWVERFQAAETITRKVT